MTLEGFEIGTGFLTGAMGGSMLAGRCFNRLDRRRAKPVLEALSIAAHPIVRTYNTYPLIAVLFSTCSENGMTISFCFRSLGGAVTWSMLAFGGAMGFSIGGKAIMSIAP